MRLVLNKLTLLAVLILAGTLTGQTRQPCVVTCVLDGCRVELTSGEIVRLIGVQALTNSSSSLIQSNSVIDSLILGKSLWLESDEHWPADFGYLWRDSLLINLELLRQGLARVWDDTAGFKHQGIFFIAEHKAVKPAIIWSLRGAKRRRNLLNIGDCFAEKRSQEQALGTEQADCFASLAMTISCSARKNGP